MKGILESIFHFLKITDYGYETSGIPPHFESAGGILWRGLEIGNIGTINRSILTQWDIPHDVIYAEIGLDPLWAGAGPARTVRVKLIAKFPSVRRDVAVIIDENISIDVLETVMKNAASPYLQETELFDQYAGKNIPKGKRSLAFSLAYQKETGTFTDQEITVLQDRVGEALKSQYRVEFR